jgi:hypothetical protein
MSRVNLAILAALFAEYPSITGLEREGGWGNGPVKALSSLLGQGQVWKRALRVNRRCSVGTRVAPLGLGAP